MVDDDLKISNLNIDIESNTLYIDYKRLDTTNTNGFKLIYHACKLKLAVLSCTK